MVSVGIFNVCVFYIFVVPEFGTMDRKAAYNFVASRIFENSSLSSSFNLHQLSHFQNSHPSVKIEDTAPAPQGPAADGAGL